MFLREPRREFDCVNAVHRESNLENQRRRPDSDSDSYAASSTATRSPSTSRRPCMYASPKPISGSRISRIRVPRSERITLATGKASEGETSPRPGRWLRNGRTHDPARRASAHRLTLVLRFLLALTPSDKAKQALLG